MGGAASCLRHDAAPLINVNKWRALRARHLFTYISDELLKVVGAKCWGGLVLIVN